VKAVATTILLSSFLALSSAAQGGSPQTRCGGFCVPPAATAAKLSELFLSTSPDLYKPEGYRAPKAYGGGKLVHYSVVSLWVNALECARIAGDADLEKRLVAAFEPAYGEKKSWMNDCRHVDLAIVGAIPLEIAALAGDERAKSLGLGYADRQWEEPRDGLDWGDRWYDVIPLEERRANWEKGYSPQTRLWLDDMYMITLLQGLAGRVTGDRKYVDRAAREMCLYIERLPRPDGLFNHAPEAPFAWGRGNGWLAAAMAMNLAQLPEDSEWRGPILSGYRKMMEALAKWQRPNGLWGQLVDDPDSYDETSATAMFAYAFAEGAKAGVLGPEYREAAVRAYNALVRRLDEHGNLSDVCVGTGWRNDRHHYLTRPRANGDPHGQAPLLWLCRALMQDEGCRGAARLAWPEPTREAKPWVYNWWMGSAVDEAGLERQCRELADKGFGGFHVIPIYGAKGGYEKDWKPLLSPRWIEAWNLAAGLASRNGLGIDLTMGSGWCFGGPWIDKGHAASSGMKVKRAGPGGTGYMIDPFDPEAMKLHVAQFDKWFGKDGKAARPRAFYHDSYEYYGAKPKNGGDVDESQLACFEAWTDWCRENGYLTRNEAHGAPSNWLDFYALADIPETEMFGKDDRDILVSKFASSAAHAKGTTLVSAESCTWIDEHFRERPSEIKAFLDRLFLAGVNHVFYHGCCYSPVDAAWPGWCFYASLEMNPRNPIWREMGALNAYVTRCQSLFQAWTPDNDLALVWDPSSFRAKHPGTVENMSIHNRGTWFYGEPVGKVAKELYDAGYAFDYVSPRMVEAGLAKKYAAVVDPEKWTASRAEAERRAEEALRGARRMPFDATSGLLATRWKKDGATAYFVVNTGDVARAVAAGGRPYGVMNPLTGEIEAARREAVEVASGHSLFLVGDGFDVTAAGKRTCDGVAVAGPWTVSPVCGGPTLPVARTLDAPAGWETFDEAFSGTMLYKTTFDLRDRPAAGQPNRLASLSLGDVREIARVRLNGVDLGVRFMAPYEFGVPSETLVEKGNVLEVEVTNLGSNRLRWNDLNGVCWKYFSDINMVDIGYKKLDASKWSVLKSGLLGPVSLSPSR